MEERRGEVPEKFGPLPAIAIGYTLPPRASRIGTRRRFSIACCMAGAPGAFIASSCSKSKSPWKPSGGADPIDTNGPTQMVSRIFHRPDVNSDDGIAAYDSIIRDIQEKGIAADELDPVKVKLRADYYSMLEGGMGSHMPRFGLMHYLACFTLFDGDPNRDQHDSRWYSKTSRRRRCRPRRQKYPGPEKSRRSVLRNAGGKGCRDGAMRRCPVSVADEAAIHVGERLRINRAAGARARASGRLAEAHRCALFRTACRWCWRNRARFRRSPRSFSSARGNASGGAHHARASPG